MRGSVLGVSLFLMNATSILIFGGLLALTAQ
jgi:hypothetical protein